MMIADKAPPAAATRAAMRIIRMRELRDKIPLSQSHLFALIQRGQFPKPFPLVPGGRAVGWFEADIDSYLQKRAADERVR